MATYIGRDGQIYNHPVPGGTLVNYGNIAPPPNPGNGNRVIPAPPPPAPTAGFFRKTLFWLTSMGGSVGIAHAMGNILSTQVFADTGLDGIVGGVSGMLVSAAPIIMCIIAVITCFVFGLGAGEDHNYNLLGLIFTVLGTAGICLAGAVVLALLPYAAALIGILFGIGLVIGIVCALFGG